MTIMLRREGEPWRQPMVGSYDNEMALQRLLVESPTLIPGVGPAATVSELYLPTGGSIDVVAVSPAGEITLVECKLAANSEVRRAVVGQILSYAAAVWRLTYEQFDYCFQQRAAKSLLDAVEAVAGDGQDWDAEDFRLAIAEALRDGRFRLIVAVDRITDELKGIVEYLNTHTASQLEALALELGYVADEGIEILLPRTHGQESSRVSSAGRTASSRSKWKIDDVFTQLASLCSENEVDAGRKLYDDVISRGGNVYPGRGTYPTMSAYLTLNGDLRAVWAVYADGSGPTAPRVSLNFGSWLKSLRKEQLEEILSQLEAVPSLASHLAKVRESNFGAYPAIRNLST